MPDGEHLKESALKAFTHPIALVFILLSSSHCAVKNKNWQEQPATIVSDLATLLNQPKGPWKKTLLPQIVLFSEKENWQQEVILRKDLVSVDIPALSLSIDPYRKSSHSKLLKSLLIDIFQYTYDHSPLWKRKFTKARPSLVYPVPSLARYYRWEMNRNLALSDKNKKHLRHFSYWFNRWKTSFPNEYKTSIDQTYGAANITSTLYLVSFLKKRPWLNRYREIKSPEQKDVSKITIDSLAKLKDEAKALGLMSANLLKKDVKNWHQKIQLGESPAEILANNYAPLKQKIDTDKQSLLFRLSVQEMKQVDPEGLLDAAISKLANKKTKRIVFPLPQIDRQKEYSIFFNFLDLQNVKIITKWSLQKPHPLVQASTSQLIIAGSTPCFGETSVLVFPFSSEQIHASKNAWTIKGLNNKKLTGRFLHRKSGSWLCARE